ncbi:DUF2252 domain-containing protein [Myxococcus sp. K38C18041901]|uniref:DUF2252 family protein n=1 Tax=Myxococcus guangdongensis TaxID=2906760 RepID=UPI0020A816DF|nr:DUF2252 family protein [Myxococcus guangdongensis]MCP3065373.1 DUF2252 domain-containing protein [Myxococcus guangdongensis]
MRISSRPTPLPSKSAPPAPATVASARAPSATTLRREPEQAVAFSQEFHARLDLPPARLEEKLALMRERPSSFFRMMPALFHADLKGPFAAEARLVDRPAPRILVVGDAHVGNLGTFRGPDGKPVWGLNDFDQAGRGSPEVDLTRMATSAVLTARESGLSAKEQDAVVAAFADAYFSTLASLAGGKQNPGAFLTKKEAKGKVDDLIRDANDTSREELVKKHARVKGPDAASFRTSDTLKSVSPEKQREVRAALTDALGALKGRQDIALPPRVLDVAQRLDAGGSSYGLERYWVLARAVDPKAPPVLLELKELLAPSVEASPMPADASAVVDAQRRLSGHTNPLTGATRMAGRAFLLREVEPEKAKLQDGALTGKKDLVSVFTQAGQTLARAHGATQAQAQKLEAWVGADEAQATRRLSAFARTYADQVRADWSALRDAA